MNQVTSETQECRIYAQETWTSLLAYVLYLKHVMPYEWAAEQAAGKCVLDYGCGSGYGSAMLAEQAAQVVGVDASARAIALCNETFDKPNLRFEQVPPDYTVPFADDSFDLITSFQVIEHMPDDGPYLAMLKRVLKPGGTLIVTTCNRKLRLFDWQRPWQEAHYREYDGAMMDASLRAVFDDYEVKGLQARGEARDVYVAHYKPRLKDALLRYPAKRLVKSVLGTGAHDRVVDLKQAGRGEEKGALPPETLARFSTADFFIGDEVDKALDVVGIARK